MLTQSGLRLQQNFFWRDSRPPPQWARVSSFTRFLDHTHDARQSVGFLWTRNQHVAETSTWQHTTLKRDKHPCPRWDSNPQTQQANGRRHMLQAARPLRQAYNRLQPQYQKAKGTLTEYKKRTSETLKLQTVGGAALTPVDIAQHKTTTKLSVNNWVSSCKHIRELLSHTARINTVCEKTLDDEDPCDLLILLNLHADYEMGLAPNYTSLIL